ncbi:DUF5677 domain-containing protein [Chitinophaga defluvii]|uniref:DUF5677 domain-containing protein n=1 Tax=Chitinophaga defluvii TaxID=3163343 RepID=A0ABV2T4B1_9BACT
MKRNSFSGLLIENIQELYSNFITVAQLDSGLSKDVYLSYVNENSDEFNEVFEKYLIEESNRKFTIQYDKFFSLCLDNQRTNSALNNSSLSHFFSYINTCHVVLKNVEKVIRGNKVSTSDVVLLTLYGFMLRQADQVGHMLLSGYNDGALVLWRSFYEYALTLKLLCDKDEEDLTMRFYHHRIRNLKKQMESYQERLQPLGFRVLEDEKKNDINEFFDAVASQHGKKFLDNEYGWADHLFPGKKRATARDLEDLVDFGRYRAFYIKASGYAHTGFANIQEYQRDDNFALDIITLQTTDIRKLIDPMQLTIAVFHDVNISFLELLSDEVELDINIKVLKKISDNLMDSFDLKSTSNS